jgi:glycine oxidase
MSASYDVIVVGGGAVGAACARELAIIGRKVLVLEAGGDRGQAWRAAAGMLAPQIEADASDPLLELGLRARDHYQHLAPALKESVGIDIALWQEGIARVAASDDEAEGLLAKVSWQQRHDHDCNWLEPSDVRARWPWLGPTTGALWAPRDGALDPVLLVQAMLADAQRLGVTLQHDRAVRLERHGSRISGVSGELGSYVAGEVLLAAGAWSSLLEGLPRTLPVRPVRGQMAALPWPSDISRAIVYHKDCYLLARSGEAVIGSTMEEVGYLPEVSSAGLARIFGAIMALCPGLLRAKVQRTWAGLRPMTPDGLPIIGREPLLDGLWYATGHGRNGILLAGLTGALVGQLLNADPEAPDLQAFAVDRF